MKAIFTIIIGLFVHALINAQAPPEAFNYSGAARDINGNPISEQAISLEFTILKGSPTGLEQYREHHSVTTDKYGVFNCVIGKGSIQSGVFADIEWGNDSYFLSIGLDINGGTEFVEFGTTQLISVPYALYAKSAGTSAPTPLNAGDNISISGLGTSSSPYVISSSSSYKRYIGEFYEGGVIFHLWKDSLGVEHGLIIAINDQSTSMIWSNVSNESLGAGILSTWNGLANSNAVVNQSGHTNSAAKLCLNLVSGGKSDWYLPSYDELHLISQNRFEINKTLSSLPGATPIPLNGIYWCSNEETATDAIYFALHGSSSHRIPKSYLYSVRAIRAF